MSTGIKPPPPGRPPVPGSRPAPPKGSVPPVSTPAAAAVAAVTQPAAAATATLAPPPGQPTAPAPIPDAVGVAPAAPAAPVGAVVVATAVPEKKERKKREAKNLAPWHGTYVYIDVTQPDGTVVPTLQYDAPTTVGGEPIPRRQKLTFVPVLQVVADDGGFDPALNEPLKKNNFKKLGDFYRFQAALAQRRVDEALKNANAADSGVLKSGAGRGTGAAKAYQNKLVDIMATLKTQLDPAQYAAIVAKFELDAQNSVVQQQAATPETAPAT